MTLNSSGNGAVLSGTLTQSSGHTINGLGEINAAITNNGTIDSSVNGQTLTLLTSNMTNNSLMEATVGGVLSISGITVSQGAAGQISASGSTIDIVGGAEISNGVLNTSSGGVIAATNSSIDTLASVTNNGTFDIVGASDLNITGNLVDNGTINVNSNNSNFSTMTFNGGTLSGTGTITLNRREHERRHRGHAHSIKRAHHRRFWRHHRWPDQPRPRQRNFRPDPFCERRHRHKHLHHGSHQRYADFQ